MRKNLENPQFGRLKKSGVSPDSLVNYSHERKIMLDFIGTIISVGIGLFLGTMLVDWYRKNTH